jgi:hypothetical protein
VTEARPSAVATFRVNARSTLAQVWSIATGRSPRARSSEWATPCTHRTRVAARRRNRLGHVPRAVDGESIVAG